MTNPDVFLKQALAKAEGSKIPKEKRDALMHAVRELPAMLASLPAYEAALQFISLLDSPEEKRAAFLEFMEATPKTVDYLEFNLKVIESVIAAVNEIDDPKHRKSALLRIIDKIEQYPEFILLYKRIMESAVEASAEIKDRLIRRHSLVDIAGSLPKTEEFISLYLKAMRIAMDLADGHEPPKPLLLAIAKELPKSCDYSFYTKYTLLGMARGLRKTSEGKTLYREAMEMALRAVKVIEEPYYRKYALMSIAEELPKTPEFLEIYKQTMEEAFEAAMETTDHFGRKHALIDIMKALPRTPDHLLLLLKTIEQILLYFTVRKWIDDINFVEVIDVILASEDKGMHDAKKHKFTKEKYAKIFSSELEKLVNEVNDIRLIEILSPYTHVWIQPRILRDSAAKVVKHLEALKGIYHGKDIERPVFVREYHTIVKRASAQGGTKAQAKASLSIDLGATNTVLMKKKGGAQPDFLVLDTLSRQYGDAYVIPTMMNTAANTIGNAAAGDKLVTDLKRMLLDNKPQGREYMEKYLHILYKHIKKNAGGAGWFSGFSATFTDDLFVTVPIGFRRYRSALKEIIAKTIRGANPEFIEEPLAAAIGYQIADLSDRIVMVVDFGGCTLDVMILRLNLNELHVIAKPERSMLLGGKDIDTWLAEFLAEKAGLQADPLPQQFILKVEALKIALTEHRVASFEWNDKEICRITREEFEEVLVKHDFYGLVDRAIAYVVRKAEKVGVTKTLIDDILLTGGSSLIPSFKEKIGHTFPELRSRNAIYDHSPISAVARGAALYATRDVVDRHLGLAYAVRYITRDKETPYSHEIVLEKGESLPFEKTFSLTPGRTLGPQNEIYIELAEVPETLIIRRWVTEAEVEFLRQAIRQEKDITLKALKIITLSFEQPLEEDVSVTFCIDEAGNLKIRYGKEDRDLETGLRLQ